MKQSNHNSKDTLRPGLFALSLTLTVGASGMALAQSGDSYAVGDDRNAPAQANPNPADNQPDNAPAQEPTPVRLARFTFVQGQVTWREDENSEWSDATINLPVRQGAQVYVADHSRAEVQFDDGSLLRIGGGTLITLQTLYSDAEGEFTEIKLSEGLASLRVKHNLTVYQVDTPFVSVKSTGPSSVRIGAGSAVEVAVRSGNATVEGSQGRADLHTGDYLYLDTPDAAFAVRDIPHDDSWEQWNEERDASLNQAVNRPSHQYLPPNIAIVAPNLDEYGTWHNDPEYGNVWCPNVTEAEWRPYSAGSWTWVEPFGWTWVSSEPWGWAPYHYGTWVHRSFGWAWCPGPVTQYWSPGVVHFVETGDSVTWCPLAPNEVHYPAAFAFGARFSSFSLFFSIGQAAVYYPVNERYCEARPWNSGYLNRSVHITNVTNVYNNNYNYNNRYTVNHNEVRNIRFAPVNALHFNGASTATLAAFSGRGAYRAVSQNEASVFTQGRSVLAPQSGMRPVAGPVAARPTTLSVSPTRRFLPGTVPTSVIRRTIYGVTPSQSGSRSGGTTPLPGRSPQPGSAPGTPSTGTPNRTGGGSPHNPNYAAPNNGDSGTIPGRTNPVPGRTYAPEPGTGNAAAPRRTYAPTPGSGSTSLPGRNAQPSANSGADRAQAARQSLGIGRNGTGTYGSTYRSYPISGTGSSPSRASYTPSGSRGDSSRVGGTGTPGTSRTYSPSAPTYRYQQPVRSNVPLMRSAPPAANSGSSAKSSNSGNAGNSGTSSGAGAAQSGGRRK